MPRRKPQKISLFDCIREGVFSGVPLMSTREEVIAALGEPDTKWRLDDSFEFDPLWYYGDIELVFHPDDGRLLVINVPCNGGDTWDSDAFAFTDQAELANCTLDQMMRRFQQWDVPLEILEERNLPNAIGFGNRKNLYFWCRFDTPGFYFKFLRKEDYDKTASIQAESFMKRAAS